VGVGPGPRESRTVPTRGRPGRLAAALAAVILFVVVAASASGHGSPAIVGPHPFDGPAYQNDGVSPPPTAWAAGAYDAASGYILMFGGADDSGNSVNTTWKFQSANWSQLYPATAPSARLAASLAYDAATGSVVLFGGCTSGSCAVALSDTWSYSNGAWHNVTGSAGPAPPARGMAMMTYDPNAGGVVLFGGVDGATKLGDTWLFDNGLWTPMVPATPGGAPSVRQGGQLAWDPSLNESILFGGTNAASVLSDTWAFESGPGGANATWTQLTPSLAASPSARWAAGMAYDPQADALLLVNGYDAGNYIGQTWAFTGTTWSQLPAGQGLTPTSAPLVVDDPVAEYVLCFSGVTPAGYLTSTLLFTNNSWVLLINPVGNGLLGAFLPVILLAILLPIIALAGRAIRRWQESKVAQGFNLPPYETVQWMPTEAPERQYRRTLLIFGGTVFATLLAVCALLLIAGSGTGLVVVVLIFIALLIGPYFGILAWTLRGMATRSVGISSAGLVVQRLNQELRIPWYRLQPSLTKPARGFYAVQFSLPGRPSRHGTVQLTLTQARAVLSSPYAPPWVLSPEVTEGLGGPVYRAPPMPVSYPPVGTPYGAGPVSPVSPSPPYVAYGVPAPVPAPAGATANWPASPAGFVQPPPTLGMTRCPHCSAVVSTRNTAFCPTCGRRLL
jgi:hypothetical protein